MKQYFIDGTFYKAKNKAQKEAQNFAFQFHHCLIDESKLQDLIIAIQNKIWWINQKYKQCKDIELFFNKSHVNNQENQTIQVEGNFHLKIMPVIKYELSYWRSKKSIKKM